MHFENFFNKQLENFQFVLWIFCSLLFDSKDIPTGRKETRSNVCLFGIPNLAGNGILTNHGLVHMNIQCLIVLTLYTGNQECASKAMHLTGLYAD